jgi:hypothetical protein
VRGTAPSYAADELPASGRWDLRERGSAEFATRCVVRRPVDRTACSGTVVAEWLNVSSGADAAPDWTYLSEEIVRCGHVWVGVSAQRAGVEGGTSAVNVGGVVLPGLKDSERYADLVHPGDAFAYGMFTVVVGALDRGPLADVEVTCRLATGESQSAYALTSYVNGVQPLTRAFDGFLVHSRGGAAMPLGEPGRALDLADFRTSTPTRLRDDVDIPVVIVQTETDLLGRLAYLPARQPDTDWIRLWEVAGTAHADKFQIGEFEEFLGCPRPVNRGQQAYVVRAALRHLDGWARGGPAAPGASRLEVEERAGTTRFVLDVNVNAAGGVRTPVVDAPVEVLRGFTDADAPVICQLFGSTLPMDPARIRELYDDRAAYLAAYERATDAAIAAGFLLAEDRDGVLGEARPELVG